MREFLKNKLSAITAFIVVLVLTGGVTITLAALNFDGTHVTGSTDVVIDGTGTVSVGASTATGITIGKAGVTTTIAGPVSASTLCVPTTYTVSYTDNAFKAASTAATETLFSLASSRQKLCGATLDPQTAFASGSISAMTCALGSATGGNSSIYLSSLNMMQTTGSNSQGGLFSGRDLLSPDSSLAVVLTCTATGANFGNGSATNLSAGKAWVTVYTTTLPAGN